MAVIFYPPRNTGGGGGGAATWGSITGTLSSQTDLQTALNGKSDVGHTHTNLSSLLGFVTSEHTTAPNNPVNASRILVTSSGANADFVLTSKGTGSILAQLADNASTGGNKRGISAVDLQMARALATQVASGQNSALVGGASNTASGTRSGVFSGNANNVSSTNGAIVGGSSNTASTNDNAAVVGGSNSTASGSGAAVVGAANSTATNTNAVVIGGSVNNATGLRSVVIGGDNNSASGQGSVAVGGTVNNITGVASVILGGTLNTNNGTECVILGSISSVIPSGSGVNAAILGGATHSNNASNSVILGGRGVTLTNTAGNSFCFHGANGSNTVPITIAAANTGVLNNVDLWLSNNDNTPRTLRFYEQYNSAGVFPNGTNYVAFRAPNSIAADVTWTLPNADGTNGQVLQTDGTGTLSWATVSGGGGGGKEVIARAKEASELVSSSTTLQNDDDFVFPLKANKKYVISGDLRLSSGGSGGFKAAWTLPSGASGRFSVVEDSTGAIISNVDAATGGGQTSTTSVGNVTVIYGYILTSSTAGDATFQWAQNASNAASTTINQCSTMTLTEV